MIAVVDREYRYLIANRQFLKMRNMLRERVVGHYAHEVLNKDFFEAVVKAKLDDCFEGKVVRYETKYSYPELGQRDLLVSYFPIEGASGIDRVACIVHDITDRKRSEEALAGMGRKLIQAHEEERTRIARELHDDINQKVALLAVNIQTLKQDLPAFEKKTSRQVEEICERVADLGDAIQALSHRLHSSKLEYRGLGSAAEAFCKELSARQNVEIDFHSQDIPRELPKEIALCLFRVLQEALQNAVKHSGVRQFEVLLKAASNEIQLSVHDSGVGFDLQKAMSGHGLGFTSMKERMKLIDGHLSIDLKPEGGTTIRARVPLSPKVRSAGADG
jgi:PAS domain S-box-containing protein